MYVVVGERIIYDHRILWKRFKGWIGRVVVILDYKSIRIFYERGSFLALRVIKFLQSILL